MKFALLLFLLGLGNTLKSQTIHKSSIDSLIRKAKNKKEKKVIRDSFDTQIKENLIGSWTTINSILHFKENNSIRIENKDSTSFERKYFVKDGMVTIVEESEPWAKVNFKIKSFYYVRSISPHKIEWNYPDRRMFSSAIRLTN